MLRGASNMEIGNYKAAIEAYQKALEVNPNNREASRTLGIAFERNGQTNQAIAQFDRYLSRYADDAEIAFKQADYLGWSRYAYRREDAIKYYRLGLSVREDLIARHKLAKLLGREKDNLDEALEEYRKLIAKAPDDAAYQAEYRKLLLWDRRHRDEAIREYAKLADRHPSDREVNHQLAKLVADDPTRADEAIARYQKLVAANPRDRTLRREYAQVLARRKDRRAEARAQYRSLLESSDDFATRKEYAELLAADESTRSEAIDQYRALLRKAPENTSVRLGYARLLGARKETSDDAIVEYRRVLAREPKSAEAHTGLAKAYAWNGDNDRAIEHSRLAQRYGARQKDAAALEGELTVGRESSPSLGFRGLFQPGAYYGLFGFALPVAARVDVTPFLTLFAEAGYEAYASRSLSAGHAFGEGGIEFRPSVDKKLEARVGYHAIRDGVQGLALLLRYQVQGDGFWVRPGFERRPRYDSLMAVAGERFGSSTVGAVAENVFSVHAETQGEWVTTYVSPYAGWISQASPGNENFVLGALGGIGRTFYSGGAVNVAGALRLQFAHYGSDHSGFSPTPSEPRGGGYFSPKLYLNGSPRLELSYSVPRSVRLTIAGGPALQYQLSLGGGHVLPGGELDVYFAKDFADQLRLTAGFGFIRAGDAYSRYGFHGALAYLL